MQVGEVGLKGQAPPCQTLTLFAFMFYGTVGTVGPVSKTMAQLYTPLARPFETTVPTVPTVPLLEIYIFYISLLYFFIYCTYFIFFKGSKCL